MLLECLLQHLCIFHSNKGMTNHLFLIVEVSFKPKQKQQFLKTFYNIFLLSYYPKQIPHAVHYDWTSLDHLTKL